MISFMLNGEKCEVEAQGDTPLLHVLRNEFSLVGAKNACGLEQCGACKIIVDGYALPSCKIAVKELDGREIVTIEHLSRNGKLHAVQQAFIDEQAVQCGFCTGGFIAAAAALLDKHPAPSDEEIRKALKYHLCRCGVYPRVMRAVKRAAGLLDGRTPVFSVVDRPLKQVAHNQRRLLPSLERTPELDHWLQVNTNGTVTLFAGKVELGQGILTSFAQIAAEELDLHVDRIVVASASTGRTPNEGLTVGSMSLMTTGNAVRVAAAEARQYMISLAYEELEANLADLMVRDGVITDQATGRSVTYWELMGGKSFGRQITGNVPLKSFNSYSLVGQSSPRLDIKAKVIGEPAFVHDLALPGMLHARVLKPPAPGARLEAFDAAEIEAQAGVLKVVRDGSFLGVIAETEIQAVHALEAMRATAQWYNPEQLAGGEDQAAHLRSLPYESFHIVDGAPTEEDVPEALIPDDAVQVLSAEYFRPFQMHAALGPSAAVAQMKEGHLTLWVHSQGVYPIQGTISHVLGLKPADVSVIHQEGPGCYGHSGADDAGLDAAILARAYPGAPISLKWTREDEHAWEPYAPAMSMRMMAGLDNNGDLLNWDHQVRTYPHFGRARVDGETSGLLSAWYLEEPFLPTPPQPSQWPHSSGYRNADPLYELPGKRIVKHYVPERPLRTSSMRGLGAFANVFAIESFMDELAYAAGKDPVDFRLAYLKDARARDVLEAAAAAANWRDRNSARKDGNGQGIAFARYKNSAAYCAVVVEVEVEPESSAIRLKKAFIAADAGQVVNPDGLSNQLEGGLVQAASWTLKEQVQYGPEGIRSTDWASYPILNFDEAPEIQTVIVNRPGSPFLGAGEASSGPAGAAIANAIFDATGVRLRSMPLKLK